MNNTTISSLFSKICALIVFALHAEGGCMTKMSKMRNMKFVEVIYDDWNGIKRPIGVIHEIKMASGERREVFTFCCKGSRQPGLALFVDKRTGNMCEDMSLSYDQQDLIPAFLKSLPDTYRETYFQPMAQRAAA